MCNGFLNETETITEKSEAQLIQHSNCSMNHNDIKPKRRHTKRNKAVEGMSCSNCGCTSTPLWRRGPEGEHLCNACGLYLKARGSLRRVTKSKREVKGFPELTAMEDSGNCPGNGNCNGTGGSLACKGCPVYNQRVKPNYVCANCSATTTPLWRRNSVGEPICNACGLYQKIHGAVRPVSMRRNVIKRRKRMSYHELAGECIQEVSSDLVSSPKAPTRVIASVHRSEVPFAYSKNPNKRILSEMDYPSHSIPNKGLTIGSASFDWLQEVNRSLLKSPRKLLKSPSESDLLYTCTTPALSNDEENSEPNKLLMSSNSSITNSFEEAPLPRHPSPIRTPDAASSLASLPVSTLLAHRKELQNEVDKLKSLLSQTTQLLSGLDSHLHSSLK